MFISQPCWKLHILAVNQMYNDASLFVPAPAPARKLKPTPSRHRFEKPIHNVKKLQAVTRMAAPKSGSRVFIIRILVSGVRTLRRRSRQSRALWRAFPRRPSWFWCELAPLIRLQNCGLVEPIGIEPMT
jgi:hypothetical protein